jgi:hypothetical protein
MAQTGSSLTLAEKNVSKTLFADRLLTAGHIGDHSTALATKIKLFRP